MSQGKISWRCCDRCSVREKAQDNDGFGSWGMVLAQRENGSSTDVIAGDIDADGRAHAADICPLCMNELLDWWKAKIG